MLLLISSRLAACISAAAVMLSLASTLRAAPPTETAGKPNGAPRVVNVTSDSAPGWVPSEQLEQRARKAAIDFLSAMDGGKYAEAYAFLAAIDRKDQTLSDFSSRVRQFNALAGAVIERRIVTITWTKDPAHAPLPGVYAALDLVSRFANIDRDCGYLILYEAPSAQSFQVMREENNFLDNATAVSIAKKSSSVAVDKAWADLSAHCPGYRSQTALEGQQTPPVPSGPLPEMSASTIGFPSVDAALAALHSKAGVVFTNQNEWTIAEDAATQTLWSFPPPSNPAYPAAVKRQVVEQDGAVSIRMSVLCEADKRACDDLVRSFEQLNAKLSASMQNRR